MSLKGFLVSVQPGQPGPPPENLQKVICLSGGLDVSLAGGLAGEFQTVSDWSQTKKGGGFKDCCCCCCFFFFFNLEHMGGGMIPKFDLRRYIFKFHAGGLQKFLEAGETRTNSQKMPLKTRKSKF